MIQKDINEFINFKKNGTGDSKAGKPTLPPALLYKKREKLIHLKWFVLLLISHLFSLTLLQQEDLPIRPKELAVAEGYEILNLPVWNFSKIPEQGKKHKVSLFNEGKKITLSGYLRELKDDPLGPTGKKAELEISAKDIKRVRTAKGPWQVYPSTLEKETSKRRAVYEIQF
ncbi:MAG: hypothetical protein NXH75_16370 [Halobacteriovoraceae bacterium]|nr:hypothetical protein [Halobacteriovoraceae bacterium]